jgi:hypothetical protein
MVADLNIRRRCALVNARPGRWHRGHELGEYDAVIWLWKKGLLERYKPDAVDEAMLGRWPSYKLTERGERIRSEIR